MEFLLPAYIMYFPGMLPSTFHRERSDEGVEERVQDSSS